MAVKIQEENKSYISIDGVVNDSIDCTVQLKNYFDLQTWVEMMGGRNSVSRKFGINPSTLHRYIVGDQPTPKWLTEFIKLSNTNGELRQEICRYKRRFGKLGNDLGQDIKLKVD